MDPAVAAKMESGWKSISSSDSKSLLKKYLTKEVFEQLKDKKTEFGSTLLDCVQSGKTFDSLEIYYRHMEPRDTRGSPALYVGRLLNDLMPNRNNWIILHLT